MLTERSKGTSSNIEAKNICGVELQKVRRMVIDVERSGDWMPSEELKAAAMAALAAANDDMTLNLDGIDYLDASAMQVLLAIETQQESLGQHLHLVNASPKLREWFELSGAAGHFFVDQRNADE